MSGREQGAVSLVTQDYQRIDSAGAAAWKIRGDSSHEDQHGGYTDVRGEVQRRDSVEQMRQDLGEGNGPYEADGGSCERQAQAVPEDQGDHLGGPRSEGQADSDLWLALRDMASQVVANPGHRGSGLLQTDAGLQSRDGPEVVTAALLEIA
jgi:hypothetical protein